MTILIKKKCYDLLNEIKRVFNMITVTFKTDVFTKKPVAITWMYTTKQRCLEIKQIPGKVQHFAPKEIPSGFYKNPIKYYYDAQYKRLRRLYTKPEFSIFEDNIDFPESDIITKFEVMVTQYEYKFYNIGIEGLPVEDAVTTTYHPVYVDWGDGKYTRLAFTGTSYEKLYHKYEIESGVRTITIYGKCRNIVMNDEPTLISIKLPFNNIEFDDTISFSGLQRNPNLKTIPGDIFKNFKSIKNNICDSMFYKTTSLNPILEEIFFPFKDKIVSCNNTFKQSESFKIIPDRIFEKNSKLANCNGTFSYTNIITIPASVFKYCPNLSSVANCFRGSENLLFIPLDLYRYNTKLKDVSYCFYGCSSIETILESIFLYNTELTNVAYCFYGCSKIKYIPSKVFRFNKKITNFSYTFANCTGIVGDVPELWNEFPDATGTGCFRGCTNASNYASIPDNWK